MIIEVPLFQEISLALNNYWLCVCRGYFCNTVIHKFFDYQPVRYNLYCFILSFFSVESILLHSFVFVLLFLSLAYLGPSRNINDGVFQRNYSTAFSCIKHKLFFSVAYFSCCHSTLQMLVSCLNSANTVNSVRLSSTC